MRKTPTTFIDITGQKFGWWTVLERVPNRYGKAYFKCRCRCGTEREVGAQQLRQKKSESCGCFGMRRTPAPRPDIHGKRWSDKEKEILRIYIPINGTRGCIKLLNRTEEAIKAACMRYDIRVGRPICPRKDIWSEIEIERLKKLYTEGGIRACRGKFPFRTESAIKWKAASGLKLKVRNAKSSPRNRLNNERKIVNG